MTFYLSPPSGNMSLRKLESYAVNRLNFLFKIFDADLDQIKLFDIVQDAVNVADSECLIEGTKKDGISHFILRLACCGDKDMTDFLVSSETALFEFRFLCMSDYQVCQLLDTLEKYFRQLHPRQKEMRGSIQSILHVFYMMKGESDWKETVNKYLQGSTTEYFKLPFQSVLELVAKRAVYLEKGLAFVPYCKLREVVTRLFSQMLRCGVQMARLQRDRILKDERVRLLFRTLRSLFRRKFRLYPENKDEIENLLHDQVDLERSLFPPCMSHLHRTLRAKHRLRHHSRIQYSLFLKEAGLPVHEALMFWRKEYSVNGNEKEGCSHTWQRDKRRYTYSLRHLYGLEGSRINYRGHCCSSLQEMALGVGENGGCPFRHFDSEHLHSLLEQNGITDQEGEITQLATAGKYSAACRLYYQKAEESTMDKHHSPGGGTQSQLCTGSIPREKLSEKENQEYKTNVQEKISRKTVIHNLNAMSDLLSTKVCGPQCELPGDLVLNSGDVGILKRKESNNIQTSAYAKRLKVENYTSAESTCRHDFSSNLSNFAMQSEIVIGSNDIQPDKFHYETQSCGVSKNPVQDTDNSCVGSKCKSPTRSGRVKVGCGQTFCQSGQFSESNNCHKENEIQSNSPSYSECVPKLSSVDLSTTSLTFNDVNKARFENDESSSEICYNHTRFPHLETKSCMSKCDCCSSSSPAYLSRTSVNYTDIKNPNISESDERSSSTCRVASSYGQLKSKPSTFCHDKTSYSKPVLTSKTKTLDISSSVGQSQAGSVPAEETDVQAGCFEHEVCPSQLCRVKLEIREPATWHPKPIVQTRSHEEKSDDPTILKPIDFYLGLKRLVNGLKAASHS